MKWRIYEPPAVLLDEFLFGVFVSLTVVLSLLGESKVCCSRVWDEVWSLD